MQTLRAREWIVLGATLVFGIVPVALDLVDGGPFGLPRSPLAKDALIVVPWLLAVAILLSTISLFRHTSGRLARDLEAAEGELRRSRDQMAMLTRGIGEKIERQLDEWALTPSEKEVAQLLLKGLGHREIAALRQTSEKTVRQQATSVYQKASVAGRAELSAFFLEDLLVLGR